MKTDTNTFKSLYVCKYLVEMSVLLTFDIRYGLSFCDSVLKILPVTFVNFYNVYSDFL